MRLAIVGSVKVNEAQELIAHCIIRGFLHRFETELVISGGAIGIDTIAEGLADQFYIPKQIYLPEFPRWKPNGYEDRNLKIAEECTHLLCIRTQQSTTYGSGWTADRAEGLGKTVWRVTI